LSDAADSKSVGAPMRGAKTRADTVAVGDR